MGSLQSPQLFHVPGAPLGKARRPGQQPLGDAAAHRQVDGELLRGGNLVHQIPAEASLAVLLVAHNPILCYADLALKAKIRSGKLLQAERVLNAEVNRET